MKFRDLIKKKSFWAAIAGAAVLILQLFGIKAELPYINEIISGVCAVLVALGLLTAADKSAIDEELKIKKDGTHEKEDEPPEKDGKQ